MERIEMSGRKNMNDTRSTHMIKKISMVMICLIALSAVSFAQGKHGAAMKSERAAHKSAQKADNESFRASLQGKTVEERAALKAEHRATQKGENAEFKNKKQAKNAEWKAGKAQRKANRPAVAQPVTAVEGETVAQ